MNMTTWDFAAGFKHLEDIQIQQVQGGAGNQEWISATPDGARNTALAAIFVAEAMIYAMGAKPIPSDQGFPGALLVAVSPIGLAMPMAPPGTPITLGDATGFLAASDRSWGSGALTLGQQVAIYQYAMRRAVRELVRTSVPFVSTAAPMLDDDNRSGPVGPSSPVPGIGAVPAGVLVLLGVLGIAAMAAAAWTAVESVKPLTAMSVQKAAIAAQLTFDSQLAVSQIKAGIPVTVSQLARTYADAEQREAFAVPMAVGVVGTLAAGVAVWRYYENRKRAGASAQMVKL